MSRRRRTKPIGIRSATRPSESGGDTSDGNSTNDGSSQQSRGRKKAARDGLLSGTLNTRFLFGSILFALVAVGTVFTAHWFQDGRLADELLTRAEAAVEDEPTRAQKMYREYLKFRQDDLDARVKLAELQMKSAESPADWMAGFRTNEEVLRTDLERTDIRRMQVDVCFRLRRFAEAHEHLDKLLEANLSDGALHMLKGLAFEAERKFDDAVREFRSAIDDDEFQSVEAVDREWTRFQAYARCARILHDEMDEPNDADGVYRAMLKNYPDSSEAYLLRARHRSATGQANYAASDARKAVELDPGNFEALMVAASLTLRDPESTDQQFETLHELLTAAVSSTPDDSRPYTLLAQFESRLGNVDDAITTLEAGLNHTTESEAIASLLITSQIAQGDVDKARATFGRTQQSSESKDDRNSLYQEGGILLSEGLPREALERFQAARIGSVADSQFYRSASVQIGKCWLAMGRPHDALKEFNVVMNQDPRSIGARAGVAIAEEAIGRPVDAVRTRRRLPLVNLSAALELARLELQVIMTQRPEDRKWKPLEAALQKADEFDPDSNEVSLLRATMLSVTGKREEAKQLLQMASTRPPLHIGVVGALAQLALAEGDTAGAQSLLEAAATEVDDNPELDLYRLGIWRSTDPARFEKSLDEFATKEYPKSSEHRYRLLEAIAAWHNAAGDRGTALETLLAAAESRPDHIDGWLRLLELSLQLDRDDIRARITSELERLADVGDVSRRFARAMILLHDSGDNTESPKRDEARTLLKAIVQERNDWSPPYVLLGQIDLNDGNRNDAAEWYRLAVVHGNRQPAILQLTSQLLLDARRPQDAIELFEDIRASATGRLRSTTTQLMGKVFAAQGRGTDVLQLFRDDIESGAAGTMDRTIRGLMLWVSGDLYAAEAEFRGAVEQDPSQAGGWLALINFLMRTGNTTDAAEAATAAEQHLVDAGQTVALAQCFELVARTKDAEQQLATLVESEPGNGAAQYALAAFYVRTKQWQEARQLVEHLMMNPEEFTGLDQLAVRRLKAVGIPFTTFDEYEKALNLLQVNIDEAVDRSTDQRLRARLLISHRHPKFVRDGLNLFGIVKSKAALKVQEELIVAQAWDRLHEDTEADKAWKALLTDHSQQPAVIEAYVRRQLQRGELNGLRTYVERLQVLPNQWAIVELSTRLDWQESMIDDASSRIDQYIAETAEDSTDRASRMTQSASLLADLASSQQVSEAASVAAFNKADALYQELTATDKTLTVPYAQLLARHGKLQQALDLLEREEETIPEFARAAYGIQFVQYAAHSDPQVERVHQWSSQLRQQSPESLQALQIEESACRRRQQYDEAIRVNQQILKQNPQQIGSLNNLAWLLSTQKGDHRRAFELLAAAEKLTGPVSFLLDTRGIVSLEAGRLTEAIEDFETAWLQDNLPATQYHLALAYFRYGDRPSALEHLQEALAAGLQPNMLEGPEVAVLAGLRKELRL